MSNSEYEHQLRLYENMKDRVSFLQETQRSMGENLAKATLTGSSAVLAFSLGFVKLSADKLESLGLAGISWILFGLSIATVIVSYHYGSRSLSDQVRVTIRHYNGETTSSNRLLYKAHSALLLISSLCFLAGLIFLAIFTYINL